MGYASPYNEIQDLSNPMATHNFRKREKEVIALLLEGKSNKQIAQELGVSIRTVEFHLSNIYARLESHSRTEAVIKLTEMGLRNPASGTTSRVLRKSTVASKRHSNENGGNQIKRSFRMKNLLIGLALGVTLTLVVALAFTFMDNEGPIAAIENTTATPAPFDLGPTEDMEATSTPLPFPNDAGAPSLESTASATPTPVDDVTATPIQ